MVFIHQPAPEPSDPATILKAFCEALAGWFKLRITVTVDFAPGNGYSTFVVDRRPEACHKPFVRPLVRPIKLNLPDDFNYGA